MTKSNSKRFVRAAWSLLFFQVVASAGAVAVTGWAAFHVQGLLAASSTTTQTTAKSATTTTPTAAPAQDAATSPTETTTPAPPTDAAGPTATVVLVQPAIQSCARAQQFLRVPAQAEWCDTDVEVREGQTIYFRVREGGWSNAPPPAPSYGPEGGGAFQGTWLEGAPLGALIGRLSGATFLIGSKSSVTSPASGHLMLAMNDARGTYGDNRGSLDVFIAVR